MKKLHIKTVIDLKIRFLLKNVSLTALLKTLQGNQCEIKQ